MYSFLLNAALAAVGILFSNGRWIIPVAAWLAPVFLLRITRSVKTRYLIPVFIIYTVLYLIIFTGVVPLTGTAYFLTVTAIAGVYFIPYLIDHIFYKKLTGITATLSFPLAWTAVEYVSSLFNPFGTWASVAYTQFYVLSILQTASLTGLWGIVFLLAWFAPVAFTVSGSSSESPQIQKKTGILYAAIFAAVLCFGGARLKFRPADTQTVCIAGVNVPREETAVPADYYFSSTEKAAAAGAKIVVWPEFAVKPASHNEEVHFLTQCRTLAADNHIYLAATAGTPAAGYTDTYENKIVMIGPDGTILDTYLKSRPVPGEPSVPGSGILPVFKTPYGNIGLAICFDMDFPALIRQAGKRRTDILLVPGNDWQAIDPLHTQMAAFRAVENGFSLVRITGSGRSAAVDNRGEVLTQSDYFTTDSSLLFAQVPVRGGRTVYSTAGDYFAILCIAGLCILVFIILKNKRRKIIEGLIICTASAGAFAETNVRKTGELSFFAASTFASQVDYRQKFEFPNNLTLSLDGALTPITVDVSGSAEWQAAPFLSFSAGAGVGTGWNISFVPIAKGLCKNIREGEHGRSLTDDSFKGIVWFANASVTLQFDYAAVVPGNKNHIISRLVNTFEYKAYTGAAPDEAWLFKCDNGSNMNGWKYSGNFFIGYQLPFYPLIPGAFIQVDQTFYHGEAGYEAGFENFKYNTFGPIISAKFSDMLYLTVECDFKCVPNYTDKTKDYEYFRDWVIDTGNPVRAKFSAAKVILMLRF
jgi:apolipoprotein N-acyltransferase